MKGGKKMGREERGRGRPGGERGKGEGGEGLRDTASEKVEGPHEKGRKGWSWRPRREQVTQRRL